jgi:adenylate kinase
LVRHVGLTGTPGTGKKSVAPIVASSLGLQAVSINDLAGPGGTDDEVDTKALREIVHAKLRTPSLLYGHLLPYVLDKTNVSRVVVLRCEPTTLKKRIIARGYPPAKVVSNVEAELIGIVAFDAFSKFGPRYTAEVDTTHTSPEEAAITAARIVLGRSTPPRRIDWSLAYDSAERLSSLLDTVPGGVHRT